ncbi:hypothetical protein M407DRAFT_242951 [Tulasnella calospora MUT 4182]|uniref:CBM1 domain-containing protein n=1 Tax=Tulasnella calospora MUT 4182 TaxID=1051891 RepID=A0A0C3QCV3_9AGAM|nr:hypothetical protein M407DRAFT_242951 [Tulasnella calospora MUT 4182]
MRFQTSALLVLSALQAAIASSSQAPSVTPSPTTTSLPSGCPTINPAGHQCGGEPYLAGSCCVSGYHCCEIRPYYSKCVLGTTCSPLPSSTSV